MAWRLRTVVATVGLAAIGGTIGVLAATGVLGGSSDAAPQAVLRLEPASQTVSCSAEGATVQLFLDELAFRDDPEKPGLPFGIGLFQIQLGYDPAILRIVDDASLVLNAALNEADPDADGVTRTWSLTTDTDNASGEALIAGVSTVSGDAGSQSEGGPSPADGALLLVSIHFQTAGQGVSALTLAATAGEHPGIAEPQVSDPVIEAYAPVAVEEASITVEGGTCPEPAPLPTPEATATQQPTVPPAPTSLPPATPQPVEKTPGQQGGRTDCPADWNVYNDPASYFSLCYRPNWSATTSPPEAYFGTTLALSLQGSFYLTAYWSESGPADRSSTTDPCVLVSHWRDVIQREVEIAGQIVPGCVGDATDYGHAGPEGAARFRGTFAEIPAGPGGGYVVVVLHEAEQLASGVGSDLDTALGLFRVAQID